MNKISCANGCIFVDKGLLKKVEETWYGDQFDLSEGLSFISEKGEEKPLKFENMRVEPKVKTIKFHWPEADKIGFREGYKYDKTLRAHVSEKKMVDSAEFSYSTMDDIKVKREMDAFFLKKSKFSSFGMNVTFTIEGGITGKKGIIQWALNPHTKVSFIQKGLQYIPPPSTIKGSTLGDNTIWFGDAHHEVSNMGQLFASTTYQNNKTKIIEICIPKEENSPENIEILFKATQDESAWHPQKEMFPVFQFNVDLTPGKKITLRIEFRFIFIPERKMNSLCFIIPDSEEYWPCALASAVTIGEKREYFVALSPQNRRLNVLNPIMWYKEGQPLDSSIYDYLLSLREIDKICLFGVPRIEDIHQLIILLLDRGSELSELAFYIFTKPENLKELNARKEEIAAKILMAREEADMEIGEVIKNIIKIHPISDLMNAPLEFRRIFYKQEIISKHDRPVSEYLLVIPNEPTIAAITIPLARYLQAPVLIYSEKDKEVQNIEQLMTDFKGRTPLAIILCTISKLKLIDQFKKAGYSDYPLVYKDEFDVAIKIAQVLETFKVFNTGFETNLRKTALEGNFLSVLTAIDPLMGKKYENFLQNELDGATISPKDYVQVILEASQKYFNKLMKSYYERWSYQEYVVFNSAVLCEIMADQDKIRRRCNLLMAGNYAFYRNAPLIPIKPTTDTLENGFRTFLTDIDKMANEGTNPEKALIEFGKDLYNALIPPFINDFIKVLIPNTLPYFTISNIIPLELIHDTDNFWNLIYGLGRMSGLDQFSTALMINLSVSILPVPKEILKILLIANPTLDLPDASKELVQLTQRLTEFEIEKIEGWDARENNVIMSINRGPNIIHYSGHGYLDPVLPLRSGLILTDSRLTALEIAHLKLWTNPLVFTNACLSAALGTAFLHAGACFFVSPLWSVSDFGALEYAYTFYSSVLNGWSLGDAQRIAKIFNSNLMRKSKEFASDFTWLAYNCFGDPSYSLLSIKPWEKHVFGEIVYAAQFVKQKSAQCARNQVIKPLFGKILNQIKLLAKETGDSAFKPILKPLEDIVKLVNEAKEDTWAKLMKTIQGKIEELDELGKKIGNLNIQDRVRQLIGMIDRASIVI